MDKERWKIQNKLYQLKEKERILESHLQSIQESEKFITNFKLYNNPNNLVWYKWFATICLFTILHLDKIFGYHYMKFTALREIKKYRSLLIQTRKEIEYYENCS